MPKTSSEQQGGPSTYAAAADVYRERGLSVIPCAPGEKFPGQFAYGRWGPAKGWDKFCDRMPTQLEIELWDRWPDAGVCLALGASSAPRGKILVAIDIDTDEPGVVIAIKRALPGSPVVKRGRKGETQFYLANPCVANRSYNDGSGRRMLDLLAHGRQTVMPPTIHPDTGQPYRWVTPDTFDDVAVADLPELPDDIVERLAKALEPFGYKELPKLGEREDADLGGDKVHRTLNDAALANLDAWVPELGLFKCRKVGAGYKAVASWRPSSSGRPEADRAQNLSIAPTGICDFGGAHAGYTALDLVVKARNLGLDEAFAWLQERVAPAKIVSLAAKRSLRAAQRRPGNLAFMRLEPFMGEPIADATLGHANEDDRPVTETSAQEDHAEAPGSIQSKSQPVDLWQHYEAPSVPKGLLPSVIETFAFEHAEVMGADPAGLAMSSLCVCAAAINDEIELQVKHYDPTWRESARLWVGLVGMPSTKKSPILNAAMRPFRRIDQKRAQANDEALTQHLALPAQERATRRAPKQPRYVVEDTTVESLQQVLADSPHGILSIQDELTGWFASMEKYNTGKGAGADRAFWLKANNGGAYSVNRVVRGSALIPNLSISVLGGIQPDPMRKLASDTIDDGLIQRFVPVMLRPASVGVDTPCGDAVAEYEALVVRLVALRAPRIGNIEGRRPLTFSTKARAVRERLEAEHVSLVRSLETVSPKLAAHFGKMDGIFARLCVVWHCVEHSATELPLQITGEIAERVARFMNDFLRPNAVAFYAGLLGMSAGHEDVMALASVIVSERLTEVTARDVQRSSRALRSVTADQARRLCEKLEAFGWLEPMDPRTRSNSPRWRVIPEVHKIFAERGKQEAERRSQAREAFRRVFPG